jgi:hypothetical protein
VSEESSTPDQNLQGESGSSFTGKTSGGPLANPYASPINEAVKTKSRKLQGYFDFGVVIRRWEKLRLYYNGILVVIVLAASLILCPQKLLSIEYCAALILGGIVSNVCFFAGPALEGYGTYFKIWNPVMSYMLFAAGLLLTAIGAILNIAFFP